MTEFIIQRFIQNHENTKNSAVRERYGVVSGAVGIFCNLCLFALKLAAGILSGAISIIADAFNNLSDAGSSIATLLGFKLAGRPADPSHPFGHGRVEYLTGLLIAAMIILVGVELLRTSAEKILSPSELTPSLTALFILGASIVVKLWMFYFNRNFGQKIQSETLAATAADSLNDCVATAGVLCGITFYSLTGINLDGYIGVGVALFIIYSGIMTGKDTIQPLLGQSPDTAFVQTIEAHVRQFPAVLGMHDLIVHDYGPGRRFVSLHAEISAAMDMLAAHELIDRLEYELYKLLGCEVTIHMDPIMLDDENVNRMRRQVEAIVKASDPAFTMHDFRMTNYHSGNRILFDILVPFQYKKSDAEIKRAAAAAIEALDPSCHVIVHIDHSYV